MSTSILPTKLAGRSPCSHKKEDMKCSPKVLRGLSREPSVAGATFYEILESIEVETYKRPPTIKILRYLIAKLKE